MAVVHPQSVVAKESMVLVEKSWQDLQLREGDLTALREQSAGAAAEDEDSADESDGDEERDAVLAPNLSAIVDVTRRIEEAREKATRDASFAARWALIAKVRQVVAKATDAERKATDGAAKRAANLLTALHDIPNMHNAAS